MKQAFVFMLLLMLLATSCGPSPFDVRETVESMKGYIPEISDFIEDTDDLLDTLLTIQTQYNEYRYHISGVLVTVFSVTDKNTEIEKGSIDLCSYLNNDEKRVIKELSEILPEDINIFISSDEIAILFRRNEHRDAAIYLSTLFTDFTGEIGAYCEKIDDVWNALIYYYPPA